MGVTSNTFTNESDPSAACNFHAGLEDTPVNTPNVVVDQWNLLTETQKQDLLNFLRSL